MSMCVNIHVLFTIVYATHFSANLNQKNKFVTNKIKFNEKRQETSCLYCIALVCDIPIIYVT